MGRQRYRADAGAIEDSSIHEAPATLVPPTEGEDIVADYASLGLTLGRHPLALLRARLQRQHVPPPPNRVARTAAWPSAHVTGSSPACSARGPPTASLSSHSRTKPATSTSSSGGRPGGASAQEELLRSNLLTVYGTLERAGEVVHLIAGRLRDQSALLGKLTTTVTGFSLSVYIHLPFCEIEQTGEQMATASRATRRVPPSTIGNIRELTMAKRPSSGVTCKPNGAVCRTAAI